MLAATIAGGYYGARFARILPAPALRVFVVVLNATVTTALFARGY